MPAADLITVARIAGEFETLLSLLEQTGLTETVRSGEYTIFAPTDAAFSELPRELLSNLLAEENRDQLRSILVLFIKKKGKRKI